MFIECSPRKQKSKCRKCDYFSVYGNNEKILLPANRNDKYYNMEKFGSKKKTFNGVRYLFKCNLKYEYNVQELLSRYVVIRTESAIRMSKFTPGPHSPEQKHVGDYPERYRYAAPGTIGRIVNVSRASYPYFITVCDFHNMLWGIIFTGSQIKLYEPDFMPFN